MFAQLEKDLIKLYKTLIEIFEKCLQGIVGHFFISLFTTRRMLGCSCSPDTDPLVTLTFSVGYHGECNKVNKLAAELSALTPTERKWSVREVTELW